MHTRDFIFHRNCVRALKYLRQQFPAVLFRLGSFVFHQRCWLSVFLCLGLFSLFFAFYYLINLIYLILIWLHFDQILCDCKWKWRDAHVCHTRVSLRLMGRCGAQRHFTRTVTWFGSWHWVLLYTRVYGLVDIGNIRKALLLVTAYRFSGLAWYRRIFVRIRLMSVWNVELYSWWS